MTQPIGSLPGRLAEMHALVIMFMACPGQGGTSTGWWFQPTPMRNNAVIGLICASQSTPSPNLSKTKPTNNQSGPGSKTTRSIVNWFSWSLAPADFQSCIQPYPWRVPLAVPKQKQPTPNVVPIPVSWLRMRSSAVKQPILGFADQQTNGLS